MTRAAALILADPPRPGACLPGLEPLLGPEGCARLQAVLVRRAAAWAEEAAPGRAFVAASSAGDSLTGLVPGGVEVFAQAGADPGERLLGAIEEVFARGASGPLLVAGTAVPRLGPGHAAAALTDIAEGCDATFGPALEGGFYLAGLAGPESGIFALPTEVWAGEDLLGTVIRRAHDHGLELGLLRYERELRGPLDVHAMIADPLSPPDVVAALLESMPPPG